jgi:hypothetical protein
VIRVTVDLLPMASEQRKSTLGKIVIVNDGTGDEYFGNYDVARFDGDRVIRHVRVENHIRAEGWDALLRYALEELTE